MSSPIDPRLQETRRHFFGRTATGIGTAALASLLNPRLFAGTRRSRCTWQTASTPLPTAPSRRSAVGRRQHLWTTRSRRLGGDEPRGNQLVPTHGTPNAQLTHMGSETVAMMNRHSAQQNTSIQSLRASVCT